MDERDEERQTPVAEPEGSGAAGAEDSPIENLPETESPAQMRSDVDEAKQRLDENIDAMEKLERVELSIDAAFATGKAERSRITRAAQLDAAEAVAMAGVAMESDEVADEAFRLNVIAGHSGNPEHAKAARKRLRAANKEAKANHKAATRAAKNAYDAIRYSDPNTMGFMRFVQVYFAIEIAANILLLLLTQRDSVAGDATQFLDWIMVILAGVAFWFFINRYKIARPFAIIMSAIGIGFVGIKLAVQGMFQLPVFIMNSVFYVFLLFYFIFSKRVKATMVNDLAKRTGIYDKEGTAYLEHGWPLVRNLIIYFIVFSIAGHWMEAGMCQFIRLGLVEGEYDPTNTMLWRDWLYPFPMEGAAVVLIALFLYPLLLWLKKKIKVPVLPYVISFIANALVCTAIEFSMGLIVNADLQLWDYTNNFGNIMGQVCLQNALAFGAASSIIAWWVYPLIQLWVSRVPDAIMNIAFVVIAAFGGILWSLYLFDPPEAIEYIPEETLPAAEQQIQDIDTSLDFLQLSLDGVEGEINASTGAGMDGLQTQVEQIQSSIDAMNAQLEAMGAAAQ